MSQRKCTGTTIKGQPCKSFALSDSAYCIQHDPNRKEQVKEIARAGGHAKSNAVRQAKTWASMAKGMKYEQMPGVLVGAGLAAMDGEVEPAQVQALATAFRTAGMLQKMILFERRLELLEQFFEPVDNPRR